MATAPDSFYRDVVRAGYVGAYLSELARRVDAGEVDLEAMASASPRSAGRRDRTGAARPSWRRTVRGGSRHDDPRPQLPADPRLAGPAQPTRGWSAGSGSRTARSCAASADTVPTPASRSGCSSPETGSRTEKPCSCALVRLPTPGDTAAAAGTASTAGDAHLADGHTHAPPGRSLDALDASTGRCAPNAEPCSRAWPRSRSAPRRASSPA